MPVEVENAAVDIRSLYCGIAFQGHASGAAVKNSCSKIGSNFCFGSVAQIVGPCGKGAAAVEEPAGVEGSDGIISAEGPGSAVLKIQGGGVPIDPVGASTNESCSGADVDFAVGVCQEAVEGQSSRLNVKGVDIDSRVVWSRGCVVRCSADEDVAVARQLRGLSAEVLEIGSIERDVAIHQIDWAFGNDEGALNSAG